MAETDDAEKTEEPTEKRMSELRKEGAIHMSSEVVKVTSLLAGFLMLSFLCNGLFGGLKNVMVKSFDLIAKADQPLEIQGLIQAFVMAIKEVWWSLALVFAVVAIVTCFSTFIQTKFNHKEKLIKFQFSHLNPINGVKRIFSASSAMTTLMGILKICIILPIGYYALVNYAPSMMRLIHLGVKAVMPLIGTAMMDIFWKVIYVMIILAIWDFVWTKKQWLKKNRMTKNEVKDEHKAVEGDESTKRKMRAKGLRRIMQRIQQSVPQADVVVTNPTHYAVALKYDRNSHNAPVVVAKGRGFMALRIREIARKARVPVLERKPLARALYASVEVGAEIPRELFRAVAEVLSYVYRLKNPYGYRQQMQPRQ